MPRTIHSYASPSVTLDHAAVSTSRPRPQFTNTQIAVLEQLFHNNTHPTIEERRLVAIDTDMEVNAVTSWFQSKRKATSRHRPTQKQLQPLRSRTRNTTTAKDSTNTHRHPKSSSASTRSASTSSTCASRRPSLDRVASRSELYVPPPRTPSRRHNSHAPLWANMASSPIAPPSSPLARDYVEFGQGKRTRTLEWACARSRLTAKHEENIPELLHDVGDDTDVEVEEAVTPPRSCDSSWTGTIHEKRTVSKGGQHDEETMKAAMVLCDLMNW
ncbi:homeodomain transcription factor [Mycena olivaceomarginata]|nr:homeodomain transcription factor [Mycena olivaceomarginata]